MPNIDHFNIGDSIEIDELDLLFSYPNNPNYRLRLKFMIASIEVINNYHLVINTIESNKIDLLFRVRPLTHFDTTYRINCIELYNDDENEVLTLASEAYYKIKINNKLIKLDQFEYEELHD